MSNVESISVALFEAQNARYTKILKYALAGWAATAVLLISMICYLVTVDIQTEEYTETTTVAQDSGDGGSNSYTGGNSIGEANYYSNQNVQKDEAQD